MISGVSEAFNAHFRSKFSHNIMRMESRCSVNIKHEANGPFISYDVSAIDAFSCH